MGLFAKKKVVQADPAEFEHKRRAFEILCETSPLIMSESQRVDMTISCRDTDYIKKVKEAGQIRKIDGQEVQIMHNGLAVVRGCYYGDWMEEIITDLKGHHEPQEEKVFHEILKRIPDGSTMIELGSFWSYYSLWFNKQIKNASNFCCEPDPKNLAIGQTNAKLNKAENIHFVEAAAGKTHNSTVQIPLESRNMELTDVNVASVDGLVADNGIKRIDILHVDVQGVELRVLEGAVKSIESGKVRFIVLSTHHYVFSGTPLTHQQCLDFITENGGHIIASHTIPESFSGDGLIVASFDSSDSDLKVDTGINHTDKSLFRPYEQDLAKIMGAYDDSL